MMLNICHVSLPSVFSLTGNALPVLLLDFFFLICRNSSNALGINLLPIVYFAYIFYVLALPVVTKLYYPMQKAADLRD